VRVPDEHHLDMAVTAGEEKMKEHEEALRQILHVLGHRARDIHQAEHHRLRDGLRIAFEPTISQIDRIDIGNPSRLAVERCELVAEPGKLDLVGAAFLELDNLRPDLLDVVETRPSQRDAS